ncbi:hypothetical protein GCM10010121_096630 [Streptomyces brasiliensis]|uniref:Transposase n=1 Tax=Streptomyces brasiliensis TaxID=1954 RepID=A0A917PC84_9ACTN|nr:hypothetical protein GCM10010121_096630 [Streptomyces brasiliensis]
MGRQSPYPEEFRKDAVALYRVAGGGRTYAAVAADVGVTGETLRSWVRQADELAGRGTRADQTGEGRDGELVRLREENKRLRKAEADRRLRWVFYLSAQSTMMYPGASRDFYLRKRAEGLRYVQAVLALARRRVDVLWAMFRDQRIYVPAPPSPDPAGR